MMLVIDFWHNHRVPIRVSKMSPKYFAFNIEKHHLVANMKTGYILNHKLIQVKDQLEQCKQPIKFCNYFCENYGDDPRCGQCKGKTFYARGFLCKVLATAWTNATSAAYCLKCFASKWLLRNLIFFSSEFTGLADHTVGTTKFKFIFSGYKWIRRKMFEKIV